MPTSRIPEILATDEGALLNKWQRALSTGPAKDARLSDTELRTQCVDLLAGIRTGLSAGMAEDVSGSQWGAARESLTAIARARAALGQSPSTVARWVFALKQPLFARLRARYPDDGTALGNERGLLPPGIEVVGCDAGDAGLAAARSLRSRAIICDLNLPGLSGFEVLARLRADPGTADIPLIISSSMALAKAARQRLAGATAVLSKQHGDLAAARSALTHALLLAGVA